MRCESPITVNNKLVPCGKCLACRSANTQNWIARFMCEEDAFYRGAFFGTLTYNNADLPEGGNLDEKAVALYWKRVKKELGLFGIGFVYTYCGEYGSRRGRPHYHFICAGMSNDKNVSGAQIAKFREVLERQWSSHHQGSFVYIQEVKCPEASIRYLINYTNKTKGKWALKPGESKAQFTKRTGLVAPFVRFSQGISSRYYEENKEKLATAEYLQFGRHKFCVPRYFRKKLERDRTADQHLDSLNKIVAYCLDEIKKKYKNKGLMDCSHWIKTFEHSSCSPLDVCFRLTSFPVMELAWCLSEYRCYCYELQRIKAKYYVRWRKNYNNLDTFGINNWKQYLKICKESDSRYLSEVNVLSSKYYPHDERFLEVTSIIQRWNVLQFDYRSLMKDSIVQAGINEKFKVMAKVERLYAKSSFLD